MMKESETSRCAYCPPETADQVDWQGNITEGNWRADNTSSAALPSLPKTGCHATRFVYKMRDLLAKHFNTNGKVPWQESKIMDTRLYSETDPLFFYRGNSNGARPPRRVPTLSTIYEEGLASSPLLRQTRRSTHVLLFDAVAFVVSKADVGRVRLRACSVELLLSLPPGRNPMADATVR
ncbi:hypothetical protein MRX96_045786 [Rhipicephalus microplus]